MPEPAETPSDAPPAGAPDVLRAGGSPPDVPQAEGPPPDILKGPSPDILRAERPLPDILRAEGPLPDAVVSEGAVPIASDFRAAEPPRRLLPIPRPLSRRLVHAAGARGRGDGMRIESLIAALGDRSFGWCIVLFALVNLMPLPLGTAMITSLPLLLVAGQMSLGLRELRLPRRVTEREISRRRFGKVVMRLRPLMRPIERLARPRHGYLFLPRNERLIGLALFAVALALFLPIPLSGWLPALSLLVSGIGLVERDGLVVIGGLGLGLLSVVVTAAVGIALVLGVQVLAS